MPIFKSTLTFPRDYEQRRSSFMDRVIKQNLKAD